MAEAPAPLLPVHLRWDCRPGRATPRQMHPGGFRGLAADGNSLSRFWDSQDAVRCVVQAACGVGTGEPSPLACPLCVLSGGCALPSVGLWGHLGVPRLPESLLRVLFPGRLVGTGTGLPFTRPVLCQVHILKVWKET